MSFKPGDLVAVRDAAPEDANAVRKRHWLAEHDGRTYYWIVDPKIIHYTDSANVTTWVEPWEKDALYLHTRDDDYDSTVYHCLGVQNEGYATLGYHSKRLGGVRTRLQAPKDITSYTKIQNAPGKPGKEE